jgi:hypothetical protein
MDPGNFQVNVVDGPQQPPQGYTLTLDFFDCTGQISAGDLRQCTITATYFQPSTLRVVKQVQCPTGVTCPQPSAFTIRVTGTGAFPNSFAGSSQGTSVTIGQGNFFVTEQGPTTPNPAGHVLVKDFSNCNGQITGSGQARECIITNKYLPDADGDGLANTWETNGIDWNNDGTIDFTLPGANPNHKNLYIEVDYMRNHFPLGGATISSAIEDVKKAFANAPVSNRDGNAGVTLTIQLDNQIPHTDTTNLSDLRDTIKPMWFGTDTERASPNRANFLAAKALVPLCIICT